MEWKLAEAKQQFSEVVRQAAAEPQVIFNRDRRVAAVISAEGLDEYLEWRETRTTGSLKDSLAELASICAEEGLEYEAPKRVDRDNPLDPRGGRRASRRHKRSQ